MTRTRWIALAALTLVVAGCAAPGGGETEASLEVADQTAYLDADGSANLLEVDHAEAGESFLLTVEDAEGNQLAETDAFEPSAHNDTPIVLDTGLETDTDVEVHLTPEGSEEPAATANATVSVAELTADFTTNHGNFTILLHGDRTPQTAQNVGNLDEDGTYDGTRFHRVIEGFMNQGGDPLSADESNKDRWGTGDPGYKIVDEFACQDGTVSNDFQPYESDQDPCQGHGGLALTHDGPGVVSMANSGQPQTGGSQFFVTVTETPHLDGTHPVFGQVVEGMDAVREINQVPTDDRDRPEEDVVVEDVTIEGPLPGVTVEKIQ